MILQSGSDRQILRDLLLARPVLLWLLFLVVVTMLAVVAKKIAPDLLSGPAGVGPLQVGLQFAMLLMVLPFAARIGRERLGFCMIRDRRALAVLIFPIATVLLGYFVGFREIGLSTLIFALLSVGLAGMTEELAFRGILLDRLLARGIWPAVTISSILFGLMHLANLFVGSPWYTVLLQVVFAAMAGTGYAAMRLRTSSLWPPIVLNALFDLTFRVAAVESGSMFVNVIHMLHGVGWLIYALVVLRRVKRTAITISSTGR